MHPWGPLAMEFNEPIYLPCKYVVVVPSCMMDLLRQSLSRLRPKLTIAASACPPAAAARTRERESPALLRTGHTHTLDASASDRESHARARFPHRTPPAPRRARPVTEKLAPILIEAEPCQRQTKSPKSQLSYVRFLCGLNLI